jgi:GrpB-like predicted nucleotidyltransferase (UPF0157 family)
MAEPVTIVPYDPSWPAAFEAERQALALHLGAEAVNSHHVGSTAIPHMPGKPVLDILVELRTYPPSAACIAALARLGYEHMGESGVPGRIWFRKGRPRTHHIHAVPVDGIAGLRQLTLRDWLRSHPRDAQQYAAFKRAAAAQHTDDIDSAAYAQAKTQFIARMLKQAGADSGAG